MNPMYPILFSIGSIDFKSSTIFFILGCIAGLIVGREETKRLGILEHRVYEPITFWTFFLLFLPFVYFFGMVNTWIFNWEYYSQASNWRDFAFSGWISYGGIIGALVFSLIYDKLYPIFIKRQTVTSSDIIALVLPAYESVYRIGCLLNGCCNGMKTTGLLGFYLPDAHGNWAMRYPTQFFYIVLGVGLFLFLWFSRKKKQFEGEIALRYLLIYGIGRFLIDPMRADKYYIGGTNIYLFLDLSFVFISLLIMALKRKKQSLTSKSIK